MKPLTNCLLILLVLALGACAPVGAGPATGAPATLAPTVAPTASPVPSPPPAATPILLDPCLLGAWTMDVYALNNKFLDLTGSPILSIIAPSLMSIEFRENQSFAVEGSITIRGEMSGGNYMELDGYHQASGSYAADGRLLSFIAAQDIVDFGEMRVYINGQLSQGVFEAGPPPEAMLSLPADAAYACSGNSLKITFEGPRGTVTEEWSR